ncbi:MAG: hypothetical protein PHH06_04070 [Candidatus Gracilibacteria bacterium]|nr:hypothetical protein [Candidatus Gracilibacteria bacterium]
MKSRINQILEDINRKKDELIKEYTNLKEKYGFNIIKGKVVFNNKVRELNKVYKKSIIESIFTSTVRELLSAPFIYAMIIPALILDLFLFIYQNTFFRFLRIPFVKREDYFEYDRKKLDYLNGIQKFNCLYCSYVNGLFSYAVEIAGRTEMYWCPVKHAKKKNGGHDWEAYFADFGDPKGFKDTCNRVEVFYEQKN